MPEQSYLLTDQERDRFVWWLTKQAETSKGMIQQFEKLGVHQQITTAEKNYLQACMLLALRLESSESMTIS